MTSSCCDDTTITKDAGLSAPLLRGNSGVHYTISPCVIISLFVVLGVFAVISASGGLLLQDSQAVLFPLVVLAFYKAIDFGHRRVEAVVLIAALLGWAFTTPHIRGYLGAIVSGREFVITRLTSDGEDLVSAGFVRRYNEVAQVQSAPRASVMHRYFGSDSEARAWLKSSRSAKVVVRGTGSWLSMVSSGKAFIPKGSLTVAAAEDYAKKDSDWANLLRQFQLDPSGLVALKLQGLPQPLVFILDVPAQAVPVEKSVITWNYLALLARGLSLSTIMEPMNFSSELAVRRDSLLEASNIFGPWSSGGALGFANMLVAHTYLLEAIAGEEDAESIECASRYYSRAHGKALLRFDPELNGAVLNNSAIAFLARGEGENSYEQASKYLDKAIGAYSPSGSPTTAARAAMVNSIILHRMGVQPR